MASLTRSLRGYETLIISAIILVGSILAFTLVILPSFQKAFVAVSVANDLSVEVSALRGKATALESFDAETLAADLDLTLSAIPQEQSFLTLFSTIEGVAATSGLTIESVSLANTAQLATASASQISREEKQLGLRIIPLTVSGQAASLLEVRSFLEIATAVRRLMRVRTFSVSVADGGLVKFTATMDTVWTPLPTTLGRPTDPLVALTDAELTTFDTLAAMQNFAGSSVVVDPSTVSVPQSPAKADPFSP